MQTDQAQLDLLSEADVAGFVAGTLAEDLGAGGDITSRATIPAGARLSAVIACRDAVTIAGLEIAEAFFRHLDDQVLVERFVEDGAAVAAGTVLLRLTGDAHALLAAERSALNTLQHLSGIATLTRRYVETIAETDCTLLDTRKTLPGLRLLEKYAARMGGACNHRLRLDDGLLIKDNHIAIAGGVTAAVCAAKVAATGLAVQVEVDRLDQIEPALAAGADRLLCDNMTTDTLSAAVALVAGRVPIEASGGVRLDTIRAIAETGVTYVSVGRITQSAPAADIGLDYAPA
ncbi:carboxylating nicotinate-nucleotide diphosphorylase [Sphingosinicella sp. LHD-64]|uniref:carboxylating nicotinate-nucleotide diphosphorylase n=1 Tax=Sphingosinicella sp. LHD-64 TaxID=3072139 RepID=UPI0028105A2A|nr:carboxylating nicotinate-nucleotide diphosphorylase [Sphingosinicella sp. LHD-64]MDQ8757429.1 carboxylating nicotinate-nucleotide diphosphorylase [Sphingosinicella sp. LHD-64]